MKNNTQTGAALMMALFFFTIASFVIMQLSKETLTESTIAGQGLKKLRSQYSAKAGLELALLRIKAFHEAKYALKKLGKSVPAGAEQQLSMIWQFPLPWPLPLPKDSTAIATSEANSLLKKSFLNGMQFIHEIKDASEKIDLNSLGSPIESISKKSIETLMRSFNSLLETDEELSREHSTETIQIILNNIADWVDPDTNSRNGGDEQGLYPYDHQKGYPRNQSFMVFSELMLVDKMDDLIFNQLKHLTTINGSFGINVNTASKNTLVGIHEEFTDEMAQTFIEKREEFKNTSQTDLDKGSFDSILSEINFTDIQGIHTSGVPILFSPVSSFYVESSGVSGEMETIIKAHVIDAQALKEIFIEQLDKPEKSEADENKTTSDESQSQASGELQKEEKTKPPQPPLKGRPFILRLEIN